MVKKKKGIDRKKDVPPSVAPGFPGRLREVMDRNGVMQKDIARATGIDPRTVSRWMTGEGPPSSRNLAKVAKAFNCSAGWLRTGEARVGEIWQSTPKPGDVWRDTPKPGDASAARIQPGDAIKKARLLEAGRKATVRSAQLRLVVEWMDHVFGEDEDQAQLFYEDVRRRYPSFERFIQAMIEKKRPGDCDLDAPIPETDRQGGAQSKQVNDGG